MNNVFKAIGDETRRGILQMLKEEDLSAGEIADNFNMTKPSISHHLDLLKRADLVVSRKEGQYVIYSLNTTVLDDLFQWIYKLKANTYEEKNHSGNTILGINPNPDSAS